MNIKRYLELAIIQKQDLLTFEEQEEYIAISTELFHTMLQTDEQVKDILKRLADR
jgi:hypothetical protein